MDEGLEVYEVVAEAVESRRVRYRTAIAATSAEKAVELAIENPMDFDWDETPAQFDDYVSTDWDTLTGFHTEEV